MSFTWRQTKTRSVLTAIMNMFCTQDSRRYTLSRSVRCRATIGYSDSTGYYVTRLDPKMYDTEHKLVINIVGSKNMQGSTELFE